MKRLLLLIVIPFLMAATLPDHTGYVTDKAGVISPGDLFKLNVKMNDAQKILPGNPEITALIVPSLEDADIDSYATEVFHKWGIGKKNTDNGLLLVVSTGDKKVRIEVGYGNESYITDARAKDIREKISPSLSAKKWAEAVNIYVDEASKYLARTEPVVSEKKSNSGLGFLIALIVVSVVTFIVMITLRQRREERNMQRVQEENEKLREKRQKERDRRYSRGSYASAVGVAGTASKGPWGPTKKETKREENRSSDYGIVPVAIPSWDSGSSGSSNLDYTSPGYDAGGGDSGGGGSSGSFD